MTKHDATMEFLNKLANEKQGAINVRAMCLSKPSDLLARAKSDPGTIIEGCLVDTPALAGDTPASLLERHLNRARLAGLCDDMRGPY